MAWVQVNLVLALVSGLLATPTSRMLGFTSDLRHIDARRAEFGHSSSLATNYVARRGDLHTLFRRVAAYRSASLRDSRPNRAGEDETQAGLVHIHAFHAGVDAAAHFVIL